MGGLHRNLEGHPRHRRLCRALRRRTQSRGRAGQRRDQIAVRRLPRREVAHPREIGDDMTRTKSIANLCIVAATVATAVLLGAAAGNADVMRGAERPADYPTHFAGFPPVGVKASTPTTGTLVMSFRPRKATGV